jgi:hypothetical protein
MRFCVPVQAAVLVICMLWAVVDRCAAQAAEQFRVDDRELRICVADDLSAEVKTAASELLSRWQEHPLLSAMAQGKSPGALRSTRQILQADVNERAMNHLVIVAPPSDALATMVWQREARVTPDGLYAFGFGYFVGDVGYIESDRNPFLHGAAVKRAPYETEVVLITGTSQSGILAAIRAFLDRNIVNAVVMTPTTRRGQVALLQRDGLGQDVPPSWLPSSHGQWRLIGITDPGEDEYRGVLEDTGNLPKRIWRAKYYRPGAWDKPGAENAIEMYLNGLHRRAYGNTLWLAEFESAEAASKSLPTIAQKANKKVFQRGNWLLMSSVPDVSFSELAGR